MKELTVGEVSEIVNDTLQEWLPGYTEYDAKHDTQYKIVNLGGSRYRFEGRNVPPRIFRVVMRVEEER